MVIVARLHRPACEMTIESTLSFRKTAAVIACYCTVKFSVGDRTPKIWKIVILSQNLPLVVFSSYTLLRWTPNRREITCNAPDDKLERRAFLLFCRFPPILVSPLAGSTIQYPVGYLFSLFRKEKVFVALRSVHLRECCCRWSSNNNNNKEDNDEAEESYYVSRCWSFYYCQFGNQS